MLDIRSLEETKMKIEFCLDSLVERMWKGVTYRTHCLRTEVEFELNLDTMTY